MPEIFEPDWSRPQTYWEKIKPTRTGLVIFFAMFYLPAIGCDLLLFLLEGKVIGVCLLTTSVLFKLILLLIVYHSCYFTLSVVFHFITKRILKMQPK